MVLSLAEVISSHVRGSVRSGYDGRSRARVGGIVECSGHPQRVKQLCPRFDMYSALSFDPIATRIPVIVLRTKVWGSKIRVVTVKCFTSRLLKSEISGK